MKCLLFRLWLVVRWRLWGLRRHWKAAQWNRVETFLPLVVFFLPVAAFRHQGTGADSSLRPKKECSRLDHANGLMQQTPALGRGF